MANGSRPHNVSQLLKRLLVEHAFLTKRDARIVNSRGKEEEWIIDLRRVVLRPYVLGNIAEVFYEHHKNQFPLQVGGMETAGIPLVAGITALLGNMGEAVNGFYIRKSRKKSGLLQAIEGELTDDPIVLVDDLINSGGSVLRAVELLERCGRRVTGVFVLIRYRELEYYDELRRRGITIYSLLTLDDLADTCNIHNISDRQDPPRPMPFTVAWYFKSAQPDFFFVLPKSQPVLDDGLLYFGADNGHVWALDATRGSVVWKYRIGLFPEGKHVFSTPIIGNDLVYIGAYDGNIYALEKRTGKRRWIFMEGDWVRTTPAYAKKHDLLFACLEFGLFSKKSSVVALHAQCGEKEWEHYWGTSVASALAVSEHWNRLLVGGDDGVVCAYDPSNGKLRWTFHAHGGVSSPFALDEKAGVVCFGTSEGVVYTLHLESGHVIGKFMVDGGICGAPLLWRNVAYVPSLGKQLWAIEYHNNRLLWTFDARARIMSTPILINNEIVFGANNGRLYFLNPATGRETAWFQVTERIVNAVTFDEETQRIYLPTQANEVYCLERKSEAESVSPSVKHVEPLSKIQ